MDNTNEQILYYLKKLIGETNSNQLMTTKYGYTTSGNETILTGLLSSYQITARTSNALQSGISEFTFECPEDIFQQILTRITQTGLGCVVQNFRMPLTSSIGTIVATLTASDIKTGSTDGTSTNAKYLKVDTNGVVSVSAVLDTSANTIKIDSSNNLVQDKSFTSLTKGTAITLTGTSATQLVVASTPCRLVRVFCSTLASVCKVGGSGIDANDYFDEVTAVGVKNSVDIPIDNANKLWVIGTANDVVRFQVLA